MVVYQDKVLLGSVKVNQLLRSKTVGRCIIRQNVLYLKEADFAYKTLFRPHKQILIYAACVPTLGAVRKRRWALLTHTFSSVYCFSPSLGCLSSTSGGAPSKLIYLWAFLF